METITYPAFLIEAKDLVKKNKRRSFVRILNLLAFLWGIMLITPFQRIADNIAADLTAPYSYDGNFFLFFFVLGYLGIIIAMNHYLLIPIMFLSTEISQEKLSEATREIFKRKEKHFLTEITISQDKVDYHRDMLEEAEQEAKEALNNFDEFQKVKTKFLSIA